jgi:RNA polymerase sigma factor (sigma-70 family)
METDAELLGRYARGRDEAAFAELVRRHLSLVYGSACRESAGDLDAARDTAQLVFVELARKAASLAKHPALAGWLYTSVRRVGASARRADCRRVRREQETHAMNPTRGEPAEQPAWNDLRPLIDDAMHDLNEGDRGAVVLRFFEEKSLQEIGAEFGVSANAARMRVDRALERLRVALDKRGLKSAASGLAAALAAGAVATAPKGLAATVTGAALAAGVSVAISAPALFTFLTMTKIKIAAAAALVVSAASFALWQESQIRLLAARNNALRAQLAEPARVSGGNRRAAAESNANDENERRRKEFLELMRLRAEVNDLQRKLRALAAAKAASPETNSATASPVPPEEPRPYHAEINAPLHAGQSLITGGWSTRAGYRTFVLVTPTPISANGNATPQFQHDGQIHINSVFIEAPEAAFAQTGLGGFLADGFESSMRGIYSAEQAQALVKALESTPGADISTAPSIVTAYGQQAHLGLSDGPAIDTIANSIDNTDTIELTLIARLPAAAPKDPISAQVTTIRGPGPAGGQSSPPQAAAP